MAEIQSFPNNSSTYVGAEWVMKWLHGRTSGVFGADNNLKVSAVANTMNVTVTDGVGWISNADGDGIVFWNNYVKGNISSGNPLTLAVDVGSSVTGMNRIDRVVVTWKTTNYADLPTITILKGTPSSNPTAPSLTNTASQRQISLARISVNSGVTQLTASMVTDERLNTAVCGIVTESVGIDTSAMNAQFESLLTSIQSELAEIESSTGFEMAKKQFNDVSVAKNKFVSNGTYEDYPYRASVTLTGVISSMIPQVVFGCVDAASANFAPVAEAYNGGVYIYAADVPDGAITIPTIICWKGSV